MDFSNFNTKSNQIILNGVQGLQFNKRIISAQCTVEDILKFIYVDKTVQRDLDTNKVASISKYIQYGLDGNDIYFSPLIFSSRDIGTFNYDKNEFLLNMNDNLVILDGQHRAEGFVTLKKRFESYLFRNPNDLDVKKKYNELLSFPISLQIYRNLTIQEERQLFTDINSKSSAVNNTLLIMYKEDDLYGKLVKDIIYNHPTIKPEEFEVRAQSTKTKLMTAATLYIVSKTLNEGTYSRNTPSKITDINYKLFKDNTEKFLTLLTNIKPFSLYGNRDKFILYANSVIIGIALFVNKVKCENPSITSEYLFENIINMIDWSHSNREFDRLPVKFNKKTNKYNFSSSTRTINGIFQYLLDKLYKGV